MIYVTQTSPPVKMTHSVHQLSKAKPPVTGHDSPPELSPLALLKGILPNLVYNKLKRHGLQYTHEVHTIDPDDFAQWPGVGTKAVALLVEFQRRFTDSSKYPIATISDPLPILSPSLEERHFIIPRQNWTTS